MPLILPNDFVNGQLADAVPVEQNYQLIESYINTELINRDGSVAMKAPLLLVGDPTQDNHAANKDYVDALLPVGIMMPWPAPAAPAGNWHLCDGAGLGTGSYAGLFSVIGYRYGGSGGTFLLPKLTGRIPIGLDAGRTAFNAIGKSGGSFTVPVPAHDHGMAHNHPIAHTHEHSHTHAMPHTHTMPHTHEHSHTHTINHDHVSFSTVADGTHNHLGRFLNVYNPGSGAAFGAFVISTSPTSGPANLQSGLGADGAHSHTVNMPSYAGTSGQPNDATSGQPSSASTGPVSTASTGSPSDATTATSSIANSGASSAANTASEGTAGVEQIPPFVIVNYIIRTK